MSVLLLQAPAAEPLSVAECRLHTRLDDAVLDPMLTIYIAAARRQAESITRRKLITQRWRQTIDRFPCADDIRLELPPVQSIQTITYLDAAGAQQTLAPGAYTLDAAVEPGYVLCAHGTTWPGTLAGAANTVSIELTTGYGASSAAVPENIRLWMLMVVAFCAVNPEAVSLNGRAVALPNRFHDALLDEYVVYGL